MAVYTRVSDDDLAAFLAPFDIGAPVSLEPIAQGIENSNYRLTTAAGRFVLTIFEARVAASDLPWFLGLMDRLSANGAPCPVPIRNRAGETLHALCGKPAALVTHLDGDWPRSPGPEDCAEAGRALAGLHAAGRDYPVRPNDLSVAGWRRLFEAGRNRADELEPGLAEWIEGELSALEAAWPVDLPIGTIHADLFPDNTFFVDGRLTGIIDFYFACTDFLAYDLAVTLNAWCFEPGGRFLRDRAAGLMAGYAEVRPLGPAEAAALPILARGAALRFLLTRLHDWFVEHDNRALTRRKDPLELRPVVEFHRGVADSTAYGIDCPP
jgi:homoserine kinase type II